METKDWIENYILSIGHMDVNFYMMTALFSTIVLVGCAIGITRGLGIHPYSGWRPGLLLGAIALGMLWPFVIFVIPAIIVAVIAFFVSYFISKGVKSLVNVK